MLASGGAGEGGLFRILLGGVNLLLGLCNSLSTVSRVYVVVCDRRTVLLTVAYLVDIQVTTGTWAF